MGNRTKQNDRPLLSSIHTFLQLYVSISPSVSLSIQQSIDISTNNVSIYLPILHPTTGQYIHRLVYLSIIKSIYLSINVIHSSLLLYVSVFPSVYLSMQQSVDISLHYPVCLFFCLCNPFIQPFTIHSPTYLFTHLWIYLPSSYKNGCADPQRRRFMRMFTDWVKQTAEWRLQRRQSQPPKRC